jgi:hypothetical protein
MEFMTPNPNITSERVKSHLQKYRKNRQKSHKEFMQNYDCALEGYQRRMEQSQADGEERNADEQGASLSCGEAAALCTYATLSDRTLSVESFSRAESRGSSPAPAAAAPISSSSHVSTDEEGVGTLQLPLLTTREKDGLIGQAFQYLVGLHQVLSRQLEESRQERGEPVSQIHTHHRHINEQYKPRPQDDHQLLHTVNQAAATAASMRDSDPYIHEVAALIPHASHMMVSAPAHQSPTSPGYNAGVFHHQQQHYSSPILHQFSHGNIPNGPHSQGQYNNSARSQNGDYSRQDQGGQQPQQHAQAWNQPAYSPLQLPSNRNSDAQQQHHSQKSVTSDHHQFYPSGNTSSHHESAPSIPPLAPHHPAGQHRNAMGMRHPIAPQAISANTTQKYFPQMTQETPSHMHHTLSQPAPNSSAQPPSENVDTANIPIGSGRTLQAQKESTLMKQEMRGQMVFQNKMRELKLKELSKCGGEEQIDDQRRDSFMNDVDGSKAAGPAWTSSGNGAPYPHEEQQDQHVDFNPSHHLLSEEQSDNDLIWNPEDDDQIFDFLMEHS